MELAGAQQQLDLFVAGVDNGSPGTNEQKQEYWNGSSWSEQGDLNLGRRDAGGAGIQTAGLVGGGMSGSPYPGTITNNTESWNGSSWTEVAEMNAKQKEPLAQVLELTQKQCLLVDKLHLLLLQTVNIIMVQHGQKLLIFQQQEISAKVLVSLRMVMLTEEPWVDLQKV